MAGEPCVAVTATTFRALGFADTPMKLCAVIILTGFLTSEAYAQASLGDRARNRWVTCVHSVAERLALSSHESPEEIVTTALAMCGSHERAALKSLQRTVRDDVMALEIKSALRQIISDSAIDLVLEMRE